MVTEILKPKKVSLPHPFDCVEQWSVTALHGVPLYINHCGLEEFEDGCSLDVEDDEQGNFVGLGICDGESCHYWSDFEQVKKLTLPKFIAHNGISDIRKLQKWGFEIDESWLIWDTQLMAHIIDSSRKDYSLKNLVKLDLGQEYPKYEEICGKKESVNHKTLKDFKVEDVAEYNACDCYYTYQLYLKQTKGQGAHGATLETPALDYFHQVEAPAALVFREMQERGIMIDVPYLKTVKAELTVQRSVIEKEIKNELGDINLSSPRQLLEALNGKGITPTLRGKPSTDKRALANLQYPIVRDLLKYSELDTLLSSFVEPYLERGVDRVHPFFNQCGTRTGRLSCSNPNLLQIPKRTDNGKLVRKMFISSDGYLLGDCDFGQIEPRLLAHLSKDKNMCEMFTRGTDFHAYTAEKLQIDREKAKILNLSVGYRATFKSVSQQLKCSDSEAQAIIDDWWKLFPELYKWQEQLVYDSKRKGYFETLMRRRIKVDNLNEYNKWKREHAQRQLINNIAQASAAEVMKRAMVKVHQTGVNILVQVYDELLFEEKEADIEQALSLVIEKMEGSVELDVPLVVDGGIGKSWGDIK